MIYIFMNMLEFNLRIKKLIIDATVFYIFLTGIRLCMRIKILLNSIFKYELHKKMYSSLEKQYKYKTYYNIKQTYYSKIYVFSVFCWKKNCCVCIYMNNSIIFLKIMTKKNPLTIKGIFLNTYCLKHFYCTIY